MQDMRKTKKELIEELGDLRARVAHLECTLRSDERYQQIVAHIPGVVFQYLRRKDGSYAIPFMSDGAFEFFGRTAEEIQNDASVIFGALPPDYAEEIGRTVDESAKPLKTFCLEYRSVRPDGEVKWLHIQSTPSALPNGDIMWNGVAIDITDRKRTEGALQESEEKFRALIDGAADAIIIADTEGNLVDANRSAEDLLGYTRHELAGMPVRRIIPEDLMDIGLTAFAAFARGETRSFSEASLLRKDGSAVQVDISGSVVNHGGRTLVQGLFRDISERRRSQEKLRISEELFRSLSESSPIGIFHTDPEGHCLYTNSRWQEIAGLTFAESLGDGWARAIHPDDRERVFREWNRCVREGSDFSLVFRFQTPKGAVRWVHARAAPIRTQDGRMIGYVGTDEDITERRNAEEALRTSEERFRSFMDNSPTIAWMKDAQGRHVYLSQTYQNKFRVKLADWRGKTDFELWPLEVAEQFRKNDAEVLAGGKVIEVVERTPAPDGGQWLWWNFKFPFTDALGLTYVGGIGIDITERTKAEEALQASEERLRAIFENSVDGICVVKAERIVQCNPAFAALCGYAREADLVGRHIVEVLEPSERQVFLDRHRRRLRGEDVESRYETRGLRADGSEFDVEVHAFTYTLSDGSYSVILTRDVTERKRTDNALRESRRMLQLVLDTIPVRVFWKDRTSMYLGCNRLFYEDAGLTSPDDIVGRNDFELAWREQAELYRRDDRTVIEHGTPKLAYEEPQTIAEGQRIWLRTSKVPLRDERGRVIGVLGTYEDITERKMAEQRQAQLIAELESVNRALDEFAHIVSHDLKAPLRAIGSLAEWIAADYAERLGPEGKEKMTLLMDRARALSHMIDAVLQYSKAGREGEEPTELNLDRLVRNIVEILAPPRHIRVVIEHELPTIRGEGTRIAQVFQNLLSNAITFADKPGGEIRIGCVREGEWWKFSIADNGPGIEEKYFGKIFTMFQTLHAPAGERGTGIGLAVVKKIIEMHGGRVWVESTVGQGSTFSFTLPMKPRAG